MGIRLINYVNNQLQTPALYTDALAGRPAAGIYGRLFMSSDTKQIFQDLTTSWQVIADAGAGSGSLQSVCNNGSTTTTGITIQSNNLALTNAASNLYIKALTVGSILFCDDASGLVSQDNTNFFWDNTNNRLGIGTNTPSAKLDVHGTGINAVLNGTGSNNSFLVFQNAGTSKWYVGNLYSGAVANDFVIYDFASSAYRLYVHNTGVVNIPTSLIIGSATPTSIYTLDVTGSGNFSAGLNAGFFNATSATIPANGMYLSAANTLNFATNTTNRLTISSNGKVSINAPTTTDAFAIQAVSNYNAAVFTGASTSGQSFGLNIKASTTTADYSLLVQNQAGSTDYFKIRGGDGIIITNAGVYNNTSVAAANMLIYAGYDLGRTISSARYKTQIEDIEKSFIDNIYKMKPRYYRSLCQRDKKEWSHFGFIAEEMAEIEPRFVHYKEDEEGNQIAEGVQYDRITALLTAAIQELNEKLIRNNIN